MPLSLNAPSRAWKGALAGLAGGLIASYVMNQFQAIVPPDAFAQALGEESGDGDEGSGEEEPATVETAEAVSEGVFDHRLSQEQKAWAGPAVHYAFGASTGAFYGALAEHVPAVTAGGGLPFGTAFWLAADEATVPALGLAEAPWEHPPSTHLYAFVSHLVYGVTTEAVRRLIRSHL